MEEGVLQSRLHSLHSLSSLAYICAEITSKSPKRRRSTTENTHRNKRKRKTMEEVHAELGDALFRRTFRMSYETFLKLFDIIKPQLYQIINYNPQVQRGPNGRIDERRRELILTKI